MDKDESDLCPCESGKRFEDCCKKEYDAANMAREKLKAAMKDPKKADELKKIMKGLK
ncbi:MAG: SEC-C metal-binding domain-containing protein [Bermanella sp.]